MSLCAAELRLPAEGIDPVQARPRAVSTDCSLAIITCEHSALRLSVLDWDADDTLAGDHPMGCSCGRPQTLRDWALLTSLITAGGGG